MRRMTRCGKLLASLATVAGLLLCPQPLFAQEVSLSGEQLKQLDAFEAHLLKKADEAFNRKEYRQAAAEYDGFMLEFPRTSVLPYAQLRKARCLHLDEKRFAAIKAYTEVLDYWPDSIKFAGAALYYIGQCHWENGDEKEAMRAWAEMADDVDYSKHYLAADAINRLADYLQEEEENNAKAAEYRRQIAGDFRHSNRDAAREAMNKAVSYYIHSRQEDELRAFYKETLGFNHNPLKADEVPEDLSTDNRYWSQVRSEVRSHGRHYLGDALRGEARERYFSYWADQMAGRFDGWDDYQIDRITFQFWADGNREAWFAALDKQFEDHQEEDDHGRVVKWISLYSDFDEKIAEYLQKLDFANMGNKQIIDLFFTLWNDVKNYELARSTFEKIRMGELSDDQRKGWLYNHLRHRDIKLTERVLQSFESQSDADRLLLELYWQHRKLKEGLVVADRLVNVPEHAQRAYWLKGHLFQHAGSDYENAIAAYRAADNPPHNLFKIAECYAQMGKLNSAVGSLREVENFFADKGDAAPRAALEIAELYGKAGDKTRRVAALRAVLKKYPKSGQSSRAHHELEKMGVAIGGGTDAE